MHWLGDAAASARVASLEWVKGLLVLRDRLSGHFENNLDRFDGLLPERAALAILSEASMSTQNTELSRFPVTLNLGPESRDIVEGIVPITKTMTCTISVSRKDELLKLRERLFHHHCEMTPNDPIQPTFPPSESDVWETARELEQLVTGTGGPTLEWCMTFLGEFDELKVSGEVSDEWAFEVLLQRAVGYIEPAFADRAIRSLAAAMHVATNPSSGAFWRGGVVT